MSCYSTIIILHLDEDEMVTGWRFRRIKYDGYPEHQLKALEQLGEDGLRKMFDRGYLIAQLPIDGVAEDRHFYLEPEDRIDDKIYRSVDELWNEVKRLNSDWVYIVGKPDGSGPDYFNWYEDDRLDVLEALHHLASQCIKY